MRDPRRQIRAEHHGKQHHDLGQDEAPAQAGYNADPSRNRISAVGASPLPDGADPYCTRYQGALGAKWKLDLFGRVRRQTESAKAQVYARE